MNGATGLPDSELFSPLFLPLLLIGFCSLRSSGYLVSTLDATEYLMMDKISPTNSTEVQAWTQEVANSGLPDSGLASTVDGQSSALSLS